METRLSQRPEWERAWSRSYLRGMETVIEKLLREFFKEISILPTRHGNLFALIFPLISAVISILPTRHGNQSVAAWRQREVVISILPTRHGNYDGPDFVGLYQSHSDPTYEAWKPYSTTTKPWDRQAFRSYLWGMETKFLSARWSDNLPNSDPTYEAWKLINNGG